MKASIPWEPYMDHMHISMFGWQQKNDGKQLDVKRHVSNKKYPFCCYASKGSKVIRCSVWKMIIKKGQVSFPPLLLTAHPAVHLAAKSAQEAIGDSELRWSVQGWEQWTDEEGLRGGRHLEDPSLGHHNGTTNVEASRFDGFEKRIFRKKRPTPPQNKKVHKKNSWLCNFWMSPTAQKMMVSWLITYCKVGP